MAAQTIVTPAGERLVMLSEDEYIALLDAAEDAADRMTSHAFNRRLAAGEEELVPAAVLDRILAGENRIRVWREHRGLTVKNLADRIGVDQPHLAQIETGNREGTIDTLRKVAAALSLTLDDLVG